MSVSVEKLHKRMKGVHEKASGLHRAAENVMETIKQAKAANPVPKNNNEG